MPDAPQPSREDLSLAELVNELAAQRRIDLRGYKHGTLQRRTRRRMQQLNLSRYDEYLRRIEQDPAEVTALLNTVLINVTEFFRDAPGWEILRTQVLPELLSEVGRGGIFRAWCAGCASGEEPYSLAILLGNHFGKELPERDIKIYATDTDEEALNAARRAEYARDRLRRLRPEWREKYFAGSGTTLRLNRDLRRLVIFGHSNVLTDAPISHCNLIVCRNLLIYFDLASQQQILRRLEYGLEPGGVLYLGKAESKLSNSHVFRVISPRWRIFEKMPAAAGSSGRAGRFTEASMADPADNHAAEEELLRRKLEQRYILDTLDAGLILLDSTDTVVAHNDCATRVWGLEASSLSGQKLQNTEIAVRCPELPGYLERTRRAPGELTSFQCWVTLPSDDKSRLIAISLRPMLKDKEQRLGTVMHCVDATPAEKLRRTVEQLASTSEELQSSNEELETSNEELQSSNEELETTNEELQSSNEELETTNEELQSTNEELETANEELQSVNEELENVNEELEQRTRELNEYSERYAETLRSIPFPVVLVDTAGTVQLWNAAAQKLLGVGSTTVMGVNLKRLPVSKSLLDAVARRCQAALQHRRRSVLRGQKVDNQTRESFDIHFTPVSRGDSNLDGVLVIFGPPAPASARTRNKQGGSTKRPQTKRRVAKRSKTRPAGKEASRRKRR